MVASSQYAAVLVLASIAAAAPLKAVQSREPASIFTGSNILSGLSGAAGAINGGLKGLDFLSENGIDLFRRELDAAQASDVLAMIQALQARVPPPELLEDLEARQSSVQAVGVGLGQLIDELKSKLSFGLLRREPASIFTGSNILSGLSGAAGAINGGLKGLDFLSENGIDLFRRELESFEARQSSVGAVGAGLQEIIDNLTFGLFSREDNGAPVGAISGMVQPGAAEQELIDFLVADRASRLATREPASIFTGSNILSGLSGAAGAINGGLKGLDFLSENGIDLFRRDLAELEARQSSVQAVGVGIQQLIDSLFGRDEEQLQARQSSVQAVGAGLQDVIDRLTFGLFSREELEARQSSVQAVGAGLQEIIDNLKSKLTFGLLRRQDGGAPIGAISGILPPTVAEQSLIDALAAERAARLATREPASIFTGSNILSGLSGAAGAINGGLKGLDFLSENGIDLFRRQNIPSLLESQAMREQILQALNNIDSFSSPDFVGARSVRELD